MKHKIITDVIFHQPVEIFKELEEPFLTACEDLYYGLGKSKTMPKLRNRGLDDDAAKKLYKAAFYFMAEDEQPNLGELVGCLKGEQPDEELAEICSKYLENGGERIGTLVSLALDPKFKVAGHIVSDGIISVCLQHKGSGWKFWYDHWNDDGGVGGTWNQDIFSLYSEEDRLRDALQSYSIFSMNADSAAFAYLLDNGMVEDKPDGRCSLKFPKAEEHEEA